MATDTKDDTKPTVEERYTSATHTSNLRVVAERGGPADVLIAMGWSPSRLGAALMRLHSEWEGSEHPKRMPSEMVRRLADTYARNEDGLVALDGELLTPLDAAKRQARDWHMHELKLLFGKLKTMPEVRQQLIFWARKQLINHADQRVAEILAWWLDHTCPACDGRKKERIANTPSLSHRDCKVCRGTGETRIPHRPGSEWYVAESKKLLGHINVCVKTAQTSVRQRLQSYRPKEKT